LASVKIGAEFRAAELEQGAKDMVGNGMNPAEPRESGAAQNVRQHGLGLVVGGVCDCDSGGVPCGYEPVEKGVALAPRGVFEIGFAACRFCPDVGTCDVKVQSVLRGKFRDEPFVRVRG